MKLLLLLLSSLICTTANAQRRALMEGLAASNNAIIVTTATPRVGIGTANPCSTCTLHVSGNVAALLYNGIKTEALIMSNAVCSATPCTITTKTISVSSVTFQQTGVYHAYIEGFTTTPMCVASALGQGLASGTCYISNIPLLNRDISIQCRATAAGSLQDDAFSLICVGP